MEEIIKLVMADVDGTLLGSDQRVDPQTIRAIRAIREKRILFGLCTGREEKSVLDSLQDWGIEGLVDVVISSGGGVLHDLLLEKQVRFGTLSRQTVLEIMAHHLDQEVNFVIPDDGILWTTVDDDLIRVLSRVDRVPYRKVSLEEFLHTSRQKVMLMCDERNMPAIRERAASFRGSQIQVAPLVTASILLEYMDKDISKSAALSEELKIRGLKPENLLVFGDQDNDADMLEFAGVGVCMANSTEKSRKAADFVTADNDHAGIAKFLTEHLLRNGSREENEAGSRERKNEDHEN